MIFIRRFKDSDLKDLKDLLSKVDIDIKDSNANELIYLSFEDENIIGAIKTKRKKDLWILEYIYIAHEWRNNKIGDGLLKVMIDKLDRNKVKRLYFPEINGYLIKNGFKENEENILEIDIEDFFKHKCSCGDVNEI